jgi:hypothetical protein
MNLINYIFSFFIETSGETKFKTKYDDIMDMINQEISNCKDKETKESCEVVKNKLIEYGSVEPDYFISLLKASSQRKYLSL